MPGLGRYRPSDPPSPSGSTAPIKSAQVTRVSSSSSSRRTRRLLGGGLLQRCPAARPSRRRWADRRSRPCSRSVAASWAIKQTQLRRSRKAAACGRAQLLANGAVDMEHGLEIENVGRRGPLSTAVTWPLADGPSVCFESWQNWANAGKIPAKF